MRKVMIAGALLALVAQQAMALSTDDLLALVAMPLAVAAVSNVTGVPESDLADLVATLNNANVPPAQFVEVIRYVPVALVIEDERPLFMQFVQTQFDQGLRGDAFVTVIEQRLQTVEPTIVFVQQPATQTIVVDDTFIPTVVRTRVARVKDHPHGGPPGQLKKQLGLKTGAEVVHRERTRVVTPMVSASPEREDKGKGKHEGKGNKGDDHGNKGKGKGKGKG